MNRIQDAIMFKVNGALNFCLLDHKGNREKLLTPYPFVSKEQFQDLDDFHFVFVLARFIRMTRNEDFRHDDLRVVRDNFCFQVSDVDSELYAITDEYGFPILVTDLLASGDLDAILPELFDQRPKTAQYEAVKDIFEHP